MIEVNWGIGLCGRVGVYEKKLGEIIVRGVVIVMVEGLELKG